MNWTVYWDIHLLWRARMEQEQYWVKMAFSSLKNLRPLLITNIPLISGKYGLRNHFWPPESLFLMRKSEKKGPNSSTVIQWMNYFVWLHSIFEVETKLQVCKMCVLTKVCRSMSKNLALASYIESLTCFSRLQVSWRNIGRVCRVHCTHMATTDKQQTWKSHFSSLCIEIYDPRCRF